MLNFCFVGLLRQGTQVRHSFPLKILLKNVARERIKDNPTFRDYLEVKVGRHGSSWSFFFVCFRGKISLKCLRANCRRILSTSLYANSIIGVEVGSTVYPVSCGEARKYARWGDYAMIAASTLVCTLLFRPKKTGC